jgi:hypothetical protein
LIASANGRLHAAAILAGFLLLMLALRAPALFVLAAALLAAAAVWISTYDRKPRSVGNFIFIAALYIACETGENAPASALAARVRQQAENAAAGHGQAADAGEPGRRVGSHSETGGIDGQPASGNIERRTEQSVDEGRLAGRGFQDAVVEIHLRSAIGVLQDAGLQRAAATDVDRAGRTGQIAEGRIAGRRYTPPVLDIKCAIA